MTRFVTRFLLITAACALFVRGVHAEDKASPKNAADTFTVLAGPTVGHVGTESALFWLRATGPGTLRLRLSTADKEPVERTVEFLPEGRGFGNARLGGLSPDTAYSVVLLAPKTESGPLRFRTAPAPRPWGRVKFGLGSCQKFQKYPNQKIWDQVAKDDLDLFLFLGDNVYYNKQSVAKDGRADWDSVENMIARQMETRAMPNMLAVMRRMPCYAIWDDHDYGPNDSNRFFPLRAEARVVHRYMWANPSYGLDGEGVYFSFRRGPVEFFMLDDRSFKDVRSALPKDKRVFYGPRQMRWLREGLLKSDAPVKTIAGGDLNIIDYPGAEGWKQAPAERRAFIEWARKERMTGLVFLSGDVHWSELNRIRRPGMATMWELTSSGLANASAKAKFISKLFKRPERKWMIWDNNYCSVEVNIPRGSLADGTITFRAINEDGVVRGETIAPLAPMLNPPPRKR